MGTASQTVAIVDDDPAVLRGLSRLLAVSSFLPVTYDSGYAFLSSLGEALPDCLIADQQMPGMTGLELHMQLKETGIGIPTIIITAHDNAEIRRQCASAGIAAYLRKPVPRELLVETIVRVSRAAE